MNYTNRSTLTSQLSDYEEPHRAQNYLEQWLNKLKAEETKYNINQKTDPSIGTIRSTKDTRGRKQSFNLPDKENINFLSNRSKLEEKPFVAAMKALQSKVKALQSERNELKEFISQKENQHTSNTHLTDEKLSTLSLKYQQLLLTNKQYQMQIDILQNSYCETDRVRVQNIRCNQEIKRLERMVEESERMENEMATKYSLVLKEMESREVEYKHLEFQYELAVEQLEVTKGEIKALKVQLLNHEYQEQENKSRRRSECDDVLKSNSELARDNQRLQKQLKQTKRQVKSVQQTYLSELQRQQTSLQRSHKDNEVLKEKCQQLQIQLQYLKQNLTQKDSTLLDLYRTRDMSKDQSVVRDYSSPLPLENEIDEQKFSRLNQKRLGRQIVEIDQDCRSVNIVQSIERRHDKSFEINSRLAQSEMGVKVSHHNKKKQKDRNKNKSAEINHSTKTAGSSKLRESNVMPFENVLIKLKAQRIKDQDLNIRCKSESGFELEQEGKEAAWEDSREHNRLLLIEAQKQAIRLYETHEAILEQSKNCLNVSERGENLGRLKQLDAQIRSNNQKIHRLKPCC